MSLLYEFGVAGIFAVITGIMFEIIRSKHIFEFEISIKKSFILYKHFSQNDPNL
jgi:hypothetical protein